MSNDPWYDAAKSQLDADQATQIRNNLQFSLDASPQREAGIRQLYTATGIPIDSIRDNEDSVRTAATLRNFNAEGLVQSAPRTAELLTDQNNTKLLHDAIPNTMAVESGVSATALPEPSFGQKITSKIRDLFGMDEREKARATIELVAKQQGLSVDEFKQAVHPSSTDILDQFGSKLFHEGSAGIVPDVAGPAQNLPAQVAGAAGSLTGFLAGAPLKIGEYLVDKAGISALEHVAGESFFKAATKSVATGAATLGAASGVGAAGDALDSPDLQTAGAKVGSAAGSGAETGAVFGAAGHVLPGDGLAQWAARAAGVQSALDLVAGKTPFADLQHWDTLTPAQKGDALFNYGLNAIFTMRGATPVQGGWFHDAAKAEVSKEDMTKLQMVSQVSAASALRERDPAMFKQFVADVSADHEAPDLYIDAKNLTDAFAQSGVTLDDIKTTMPDVANQLGEATATNGMVRIPMADYATHLAGTDIDTHILPNIRTDPDGMTYHEGQVFYQSQVEQLKAEVAKVVAEKVNDSAWQQSKQQVQDDVAKQIADTGRVRDDVTDAYAALHANFFETMAARFGYDMTPADAYKRFGGAKIVAEDLAGDRFNQRLDSRTGLPLNDDGTVTLYHHTDATSAAGIRESGELRSAGEPDVYLTTHATPDTGYGDTAVPVRVDPTKLKLDDEFPNGRQDYSISAGKPGGKVAVHVDPAGIADLRQRLSVMGVEHSISESKGLITLSKLVVPADERNSGKGTAAMHALVDYADRTGQSIALSPSSDFGGNKKRLVEFYKQFGFVENKGKNRAFTVSDSMYRPAKGSILYQESEKIRKATPERQASTLAEAKEGASAFVGSKLHNDLTGQNATVSKTTLGKMTSESAASKSTSVADHALAIANIDKLFAVAELDHSHADAKGEPTIVAIHRFVAPMIAGDGSVLAVKMTVKETKGPKEPNPLYTIETIDVEKPTRMAPSNDGIERVIGVQDVATDPTGGLSDKVLQTVSDVKDALLRQANRGTFSPADRTLALLKNADLSTFLHESGHFFLDTLSRVAIEHDAPADIRRDFQTVLDWFGVRDPDTWHTMSLEEQRAFHEQFARGFESYLMDGKAPSVEMQTMFSRFRSWLLNIYQSLKSLNVELTPDVRGVMDRMLASDETIKNAEAVRGYDPLFKSAMAAGMTPEEWAQYQALGSEATRQAVNDLEGKSIRDMKWLSNAKAGAIKALQKEAQLRRREMRSEASKQVWSEPIYQAWQFLTARESLDGSKSAPAAKETRPAGVDNERDSLFTAIAKLGGIRREQAASEWGLKPEEKPESGMFGKHVLRASGKGMSLDEMGAHLADEGYLAKDEHGRYDSNEFEEKFFNELGGSKEYSSNADYNYLKNEPQQLAAKDLRMRVGGRLDTDLVRVIDSAASAKLEALRMTRKDALNPDIVAEMFGYKDGADLIQALATAEHPRAAVEGLTDKLMLEKHGELSSTDAINRAAEVAIHNEARARFVATELKALTKAAGPASMMSSAAKAVAESSIAGKLISALRPNMYTAAEARAAKNAEKALAVNDLQAAAVEKRAQLLNNRLAKAAQVAQQEVMKGVDYLKKFDKASVREKIDLEYREQIDAILDRYDLRKSVTATDVARKQSLGDWVESQVAQGLEPNVPEKLLNELDHKHFTEMTVEEFRGMLDGVKSIEHLGKLKNTLRDRNEMRQLDALADEATAVMGELPQRTPDSNRGLSTMEAKFVKLKSIGRSMQAALLKMEQMMDWLDGRNPDGVFNRVVFRRIADAGVHENDLRAKVKGEIDKLMESHLADVTKDGGKTYTATGLIDGMTGEPQKFTKKEMLMLAGNMGNESNVAKLIAGEKWSEPAVWVFLNKNMTKGDWDFVAGMGKAIESLWPEQLAMSRRLGNSNPDKIEPRPFLTVHGQYDGWYWPMIYDPARAQDVAERGAKKADALFENSYTRANTDTGRMNTRNANYARPLLLDLDALPRVILDNIHDIAFREAVIDADKFISHPKVRQGIVDALSQEHYDQLRPWLQSIANDGKTSDEGMRALKFFNSLAHGARTRATIVGLGYRISTMLVHGASAGMESVAELGAGWFAKGLSDFSNPMQWQANRDFIFERSGEMRNRMNEVDRDIREHLREIELRLMDPATGAVSRATDAMKAHAYQGIAMLDMATALPTWMGAYLKGMSPLEKGGMGLPEQDAIYFADKTVRNAHGGTGVKDLAAVQRGPEFFKLFSMFYTFWNHNVNRIMDTARTAQQLPATYRAGDMAKFRGDLGTVLMRTLVYTFGVQIMHHMINPPKEDAGEESWGVWAAKEIALAASSGIPIVRDLAAHYISGKDYSVTPAASMVDALGKSGQDVWNATAGDKPVSDKWLKHTITTTGYVFGLPTGQAASATQFLWDVEAGHQHPDGVADWWRGLIHGDMKKH